MKKFSKTAFIATLLLGTFLTLISKSSFWYDIFFSNITRTYTTVSNFEKIGILGICLLSISFIIFIYLIIKRNFLFCGIFTLIILVMLFLFLPVKKVVVGTNCGSGYMPGYSDWDCNFYAKISLKDYLLSKIKAPSYK